MDLIAVERSVDIRKLETGWWMLNVLELAEHCFQEIVDM
jgi:hypothetical protein